MSRFGTQYFSKSVARAIWANDVRILSEFQMLPTLIYAFLLGEIKAFEKLINFPIKLSADKNQKNTSNSAAKKLTGTSASRS